MSDAQDRGAVLTLVMVAALVCSALAYGALFLAISEQRRAQVLRDRTQARYAAEAGMVWAMQQIWQDPAWSAPSGVTLPLTIPGISQVLVRYPDCPTPPCPPRTLSVVARN